jgi:hypothetical protein
MTERIVACRKLPMVWKCLLGGAAGFLLGVGVFFLLLGSTGNTAGRMGVSPLIFLPPVLLAIVGSVVGAVIGIMMTRTRNHGEE